MTSEEQQYFDAMDALFGSLGWKLLAEDIQRWMSAISTQWETIKPEDLRFIQGRYDGLRQIREQPALHDSLRVAAMAPVDDTNALEHYDE